MNFLKIHNFKILLLALLLVLSLIFNHNIDFWVAKEYQYYQLYFVGIASMILFFSSKESLKLGKVDVVVFFLLLFLVISRSLHLQSVNEIQIINTLAYLFIIPPSKQLV